MISLNQSCQLTRDRKGALIVLRFTGDDSIFCKIIAGAAAASAGYRDEKKM